MAQSARHIGGFVELMYILFKKLSLASVKNLKKKQDEDKCGSGRQCRELYLPIFAFDLMSLGISWSKSMKSELLSRESYIIKW